MLQSLTVSNIAIVSSLHLDFSSGLTTLSGETGAGKSLLLDSLGLVLGDRAQTTLVRQGEPQASVVAVFSPPSSTNTLLKELGFPASDELILKRLLSREGKSRIFINDMPASLQALKQVGETLVEIHGQFDRLLSPKSHLETLDSFGGLLEERATLKGLYEGWQSHLRELETLQQALQKRDEDQDYLRDCIEGLRGVALQEGEEEDLLKKRAFLMNYENLSRALMESQNLLRDPVDTEALLAKIYRILEKENQEENLTPLLDHIEKALVHLQAFQESVEDQRDILRDQEGGMTLEDVEMRLHTLRALAKKHHCLVDDLPELLRTLEEKSQTLDQGEERIKELEALIQERRHAYFCAAQDLSKRRQEKARLLEKAVESELNPLRLKARFVVCQTPLSEAQWCSVGIDSVEFHLSTNVGEVPGPLAKVASGGELSRLMLALKVITKNSLPTLIFDEVDTGLGGAVAGAMGQRLKNISKETQVLSITHSPQMASYADHHFEVSKAEKDGRVQTHIRPLENQKERILEIARMLSGETVTKEAEAAAAQLLREHS